MAKFKVHKLTLGPLEALLEGEGELQTATTSALCKTTHRSLLPLLLDDDWRRVTCERCLKLRPPQGLIDRILAFFGIARREQ